MNSKHEYPTILRLTPPVRGECQVCDQVRSLHWRDREMAGPGICAECIYGVSIADTLLLERGFERPGQATS